MIFISLLETNYGKVNSKIKILLILNDYWLKKNNYYDVQVEIMKVSNFYLYQEKYDNNQNFMNQIQIKLKCKWRRENN